MQLNTQHMSGRIIRGRVGSRVRRCRGFTLVEVMVALVVSAIGLLGLAKMESLALTSTNVAGARSIAALQASSLAAAMHANRGYWGAGTAPAAVTASISGGVITINDPTGILSAVGGPQCMLPNVGATACNASQMAAFDFQNWTAALQALLPSSLTTISCTTTTATPVTCTIQIQWSENAVAMNQQQTQINTLAAPTYVLYVEP